MAFHFLICGTLLGQSSTSSPHQALPGPLSSPSPSPSPDAAQIGRLTDAQPFDALARQAAQRINPRATLYRPNGTNARKFTSAPKPSTPVVSQDEAKQTMQKSLEDFANFAQKNPDEIQQQLASALYLARDLQLRRVGQPAAAQHSFQRGFGNIKLPQSGSIKDLGDIWQVNRQTQFGAPAAKYSPGSIESVPVDLALEVAPLLSITGPWVVGEPGWYSANYRSNAALNLGASAWSQKIQQFMVTHGFNFEPVSGPTIIPSTAVIFHLSCQFKDRSDSSDVGDSTWGNHAHYEMKVQVLLANPDGTVAIDPNTKQPVWRDASPIATLDLFGPKSTNVTLPINSPPATPAGEIAQGDLAAIATFAQVANIVRIGYRFFLGDTRDSGLLPEQAIGGLNSIGDKGSATPGQYMSVPVNYPLAENDNKAWAFTRPLEIDIAPSELIQLTYVPIAILYAPPGDLSAVNYHVQNSYATKMSFGDSWNSCYKTSNTSTYSLQERFGIDINNILETSAGQSEPARSDRGWDNTQWNAGATTLGNQEIISLGSTEQIDWTLSYAKPQPPPPAPRSTTTRSGSTSSSPAPPGSLWVARPRPETVNITPVPFWNDVIILVAHPQFAVWDYEPSAPGDGPALNSLQPIGQHPGYSAVSIGQLSEIICNWATGTAHYDISWNKSPYFPVPLTPYECISLLSLDPFWLVQWQGWPGAQRVSTAGSNPIIDSGGRAAFIWGGSCGSNLGQASLPVILSQEGDLASMTRADYGAVVDRAFKTFVSAGAVSMLPIDFGVTADDGHASANLAELDLSFKNIGEIDLRNQVQIQGSLHNSGSEMYITIYRDLLFGGIMFQNVGEPVPEKKTYLSSIWYGKSAPLAVKGK